LSEGDEQEQFRKDVMTKKMILLVAALSALTLPVQAQTPMPNRMFASAADVEKLIAKARAEHKGGNTMEIIANVGAFPWQINYRTGNTPASIHKHEMELIEVLAGSCTFITGGTLVDAKDSGATINGTAIQGGTAQKLAKGDRIMVPAGVAHWYSDVQGEFVGATLHVQAPAAK
jgi:hypothetical protein